MNKTLRNRVSKLEARHPEYRPEPPLDLSLFSTEEKKVISEFQAIIGRLKAEGKAISPLNVTEAERKIAAEAGRIILRVQRGRGGEKQT